MTTESREYKNISGVIISDDEFVGNLYKNITIQTPITVTPRMQEITKKINNLSLDTFYKISIEISDFYSQDEQPVDGDQRELDNIIFLFQLVTQVLLKADLLTTEEIEADMKDIKHCYSANFITRCSIILANFINIFTVLNEDYAHA